MKRLFPLLLALMLSFCTVAYAHSGRTDSSGGHRKTSDGTYHYHCGGHPAHQHTNGVCPYAKKKSTTYTYTSTTSTTTKKKSSNLPIILGGSGVGVGIIALIRHSNKKKKEAQARLLKELEEAEARRLEEERKQQELVEHLKTIIFYQGKNYHDLCEIPENAYVSPDGLPCEIGHPGNGDWGREYTYHINLGTNRVHLPECRYASACPKRNIYDCVKGRSFLTIPTGCAYCGSAIQPSKVEWYERYLEHKAKCDKHGIVLPFEPQNGVRICLRDNT